MSDYNQALFVVFIELLFIYVLALSVMYLANLLAYMRRFLKRNKLWDKYTTDKALGRLEKE
jgi:hypothetical protein